MTEYWKCKDGFRQLPEWESDCWIQVTQPTQEELGDLESRFGAPMDFIQDVEDTEERPRTESESGWLMTLIRVPNKEFDEDGKPYGYQNDGRDERYVGYGNEIDGYRKIVKVYDDDRMRYISPFVFLRRCERYTAYYSEGMR